jgi:hypothetical protein
LKSLSQRKLISLNDGSYNAFKYATNAPFSLVAINSPYEKSLNNGVSNTAPSLWAAAPENMYPSGAVPEFTKENTLITLPLYSSFVAS